MRRLLIAGAALAASLVIVACGDSSSETAAPAGGGQTVSIKSIDGIGDVLVDASGKALYASDVESDGKVHCTDGCTSFWQPLTVDSGTPTAADGVGKLGVIKRADGVGKLGVIKRADGARQVTADGKLLYTFSEDSAGEVEGNGFADDFDGQHFTWNAVLAGGKLASSADSQDGGYSTGRDGY
jgi:predicted lipoprotein with Yx(FWY)xxD motif